MSVFLWLLGALMRVVSGLVRSRVLHGVIRHFITGVGSYWVVEGTIDAEQWQAIQGGLLAVLGLAWSALDKRVAR